MRGGGGASLFDTKKLLTKLNRSFNKITIPAYAQFANAVGAGGGKVSGTAVRVVCDDGKTTDRDERRKLNEAMMKEEAVKVAVANGADPNSKFRTQFFDENEMRYLDDSHPTQLIYKVVGARKVVNTRESKITLKQEGNRDMGIKTKSFSVNNYSEVI